MQKHKPVAPIDVEMQKSVTGELIAFDKVNRVILASGFDDAEDFEKWKKSYFRPGVK